MDILTEIVGKTKERLADKLLTGFPFERAIRESEDIAFICEVKRASPSKGLIADAFDHIQIAKDYQAGGAAAISVLTEPFYFLGRDSYLQEISRAVETPTLRKDFIIDPYMICEARVLGASAVLLICRLLDEGTLASYINLAHSLGLSALVEAHDEREIEMALKAGARVIGVNNRDLETFEVDIGLSAKLRRLVPDNILFVAESGISKKEDVDILRQAGVDALLIGEQIMRADDKKEAIKCLR